MLAVPLLWIADRRHPLSRANYAAIITFLCLHLLGARYLYSNVPYDEWSKILLGTELSSALGWQRNHYDRLVHFCYGLLMFGACSQLLRDELPVSIAWSRALALMTILATSAVYELLEGLIALLLSRESAESYNGQQGDMWDAQKDMALALAGALLAMLISTRSLRYLERDRPAALEQS